jgi:4-amino-4-deoxy-L-arabinose transferase-like glycosyltransferase
MSDRAYLAPDGSATAFWPPGYPAFLSVLGSQIMNIRLAQALLGAITVLLVYTLGREFLSRRQALLAAFFAAVYPLYIYTAGSLFPVVYLAFLITLIFALLVRSLEEGTGLRAFLAGIFGALATLTSAAVLPALLLSIPWLWIEGERKRRGRGLRLALLFALPLILIVGAWTARNVGHFQRPVLVSLNGGYNFWLGNYPGVNAKTGNRWTPEMEAEYHALSQEHTGEAELDLALRNRAIEFIRENPVRFIGLSFSKGLNLWRLYPLPMTEDRPGLNAEKLISIFSYGLALPFALFFLFTTLKRWAGSRLALIFFLTYTAVHAVILSKFRFRLPLDGILIVLAAGGVGKALKMIGWRFLEDPE